MRSTSRGNLGVPANSAIRRYLIASRQLRQPPSERAGFSLLEMVVVLAIIGVLVSIQLPSIIGNTDKAKFIAAQVKISNAISECATAKANGASERELRFSSSGFLDTIPSMETPPDGYRWDNSSSRGCSFMRLLPTDSNGNNAFNVGWPILMAKLAPGGRIIKVAEWCRPWGSLDFTKECTKWDPTNTADTEYQTGRDLNTLNWDRKQ